MSPPLADPGAAAGRWLAYRRARPLARVRLLCFPYAGGGASVYRRWVEAASPEIEVWPVQLPGREGRIRDRPFTDARELVTALAADLGSELAGAPWAAFGHSMGATLAYELAGALAERRAPAAAQLRRLFVSARSAPHRPDRRPPIHRLPEDEFRAELRRLEGTPQEVLDHPELMALLGPTLRADFELVETYRPRGGPPLALPITAFAGTGDPDVAPEDVRAWGEHTTGRFDFRPHPGGHFFLHERWQEVLREVTVQLDSLPPTA